MKKAQNLIEVSVMLCVIVVVSIAVWPIINNQKMKLLNMSNVTLSETSGVSGNKITLPDDDPMDGTPINLTGDSTGGSGGLTYTPTGGQTGTPTGGTQSTIDGEAARAAAAGRDSAAASAAASQAAAAAKATAGRTQSSGSTTTSKADTAGTVADNSTDDGGVSRGAKIAKQKNP